MRQTICFVSSAERCKIEEIGLKLKVLKYIENMCIFGAAGAETIIFVTFGRQPAKARILLL